MSTCPVCGVTDALDRHDAHCSRARSLGLVYLAEDEQPISPQEGELPVPEPAVEVTENAAQRLDREEARRRAALDPVTPPAVELWMAFRTRLRTFADEENEQVVDLLDLTIYDNELDALRAAVQGTMRVGRVELGKPISEQIG